MQDYGQTGVAADLQYGRQGPRVQATGGLLRALTFAGALNRFKGAAAVDTDDFVTKAQLDAVTPGTVRVASAASQPENFAANRTVQAPSINAASHGNVNLQSESAAAHGITGGGTQFAGILSGQNNLIGNNCDHAIVVGGRDNDLTASCGDSFLGGGFGNSMNAAQDCVLVGGSSNQINAVSGTISRAFLGGGFLNLITKATDGVLVGGRSNELGFASSISTTDSAFLGAGEDNNLHRGHHAVLVGGENNLIGTVTASDWSWIPGGFGNECQGAHYGSAWGRRAKCNHLGSSIGTDSTDQDDATDRADQHKRVFTGGFTERTTAGFKGEDVERFNGHGAASGVGGSIQVILANLSTNVRTMDVELRVHGIRTNSSAGNTDAFKAAISFTAARNNSGVITVFSTDKNVQNGTGTGTGCSASISVLPTGDLAVNVVLPSIQPTAEDWQFTLRWERQQGGLTA